MILQSDSEDEMDLIVNINLEGLSPTARHSMLTHLSHDLRMLADMVDENPPATATEINFDRDFHSIHGTIRIKG
jgi:hypothetical protein